VFVAHGVENLFGVRGGGLAGTVDGLARMHVPAAYPVAVVVAAGELACGILLFVGAFTRWALIALLAGEALSLYQAHAATHTFMPAARLNRLEFEVSLLLIGALISLLLMGAGTLSLENTRSVERAATGRARIRSGKV
jgi:uncharacterized membrane protein YphA (DoxX/SURF4 family)